MNKDVVNYDHVHFGAGKLGLGLVVPITTSIGLKVLVASRKNKKDKNKKLCSKRYRLRPSGQKIQFHGFSSTGSKKVDDSVITKASKESVRLLTVSVGEPNVENISKYTV